MQFKVNLRFLNLLILIQCLLLLGGYFHSSSWIQFWLIFSSLINVIFIAIILLDLFRHNNITEHLSSSPKLNSNQRSRFRSSQSYDLIHIRPSTTTPVLDEITFHLRSGRKYIMTSKPNIENGGKMLLYIHASLPTRSLIIVIDYDHERDANTTYAATLHNIFRLIFERSKFVLGWGDLRVHLQSYLEFRLFSDTRLIELYPINLQEMFRDWYNHWSTRSDVSMVMDESKMKFDHCSCEHCPKICKTFYSWSLSEAIGFCFNEYFDDHHSGTDQCFVIGKISGFIRNPPI